MQEQILKRPTDSEIVVLVDQEDKITGSEEKLLAHQLGLLHRAFSIFVFRRLGDTIEFLLQRRHFEKYHCGGLWANTCCSHPRIGEDIILAGQRRLQEELSLSLPLKKVGAFIYRASFENGLIEHEYDHVLLGEYVDHSFKINPNEIHEVKWIRFSDLNHELIANQEQYVPWLKPALDIAWSAIC